MKDRFVILAGVLFSLGMLLFFVNKVMANVVYDNISIILPAGVYTLTIADEDDPEIDCPVAWINQFNPGISQSNLVTVSWSGDPCDNPPITGFDVQRRRNGSNWIDWRTGVLDTADVYDANLFGGQGFHEFRVRAYDANNLVGEWSGARGIYFDLEGRLTHKRYLPIAMR